MTHFVATTLLAMLLAAAAFTLLHPGATSARFSLT